VKPGRKRSVPNSECQDWTGISRPIKREVPESVVEGLLEGISVEDDGFEGVHDMPEEIGYNRINGEDRGLAQTTVEEGDAVSQTFTPLGKRVGAVPRRSRRIQSRHMPYTHVCRLFTRVSRLITDIFLWWWTRQLTRFPRLPPPPRIFWAVRKVKTILSKKCWNFSTDMVFEEWELREIKHSGF
jgi:hypothetical protein